MPLYLWHFLVQMKRIFFNINRNLSSEEELKTKSFSDSIPIVNNYKDLFTVFGVEIDNNQQYLEAYNNQKQSEISNRKSLFISVF